MKSLRESAVLEDLSSLDRAWGAEETFILLPDRPGIPEGWIEERIEGLPASLRARHFALLTSGSTGTPKIVVGARDRAERLARVLHERQDSGPVRSTVLALPISYSFAFVNQYVWSRVMGRELVVTRGFKDPDRLLGALSGSSAAMLCLVGPQIPLLSRSCGNRNFPGVIRLHFAGGPFPQRSMPEIKNLFPRARIFNNYGCVEAMPRLSLRPLETADEASDVGKPLPGVEMRTGPNGEILFRSPYRAVAYLDEVGSHLVGDADWVPSGDLGREAGDGSWRIEGRANEVFKRYGEKVSIPAVMEALQGAWKGQAGSYLEKDKAGEEGYVLVLSPQPDDSQAQAVLQVIRKNHPRTHWPLRLESTAHLPLLANGKVDSAGLRHVEAKRVHWDQRI